LPINLVQWTVDELHTCLKRCDIYMSILQRGGQDTKYVATTKNSKMKGRTLTHNKGITFQCLDSEKIIIYEKPKKKVEPKRLPPGMTIKVKYGKLRFPATVVKFDGFELYTILYENDRRKEVGVHRDRITVVWPENPEIYKFADNPKKNGWPFFCCALSKGSTVVGFCGIDGFESQPKGRVDEAQPEEGITDYIRTAAKYLGTALFEHRITSSLDSFSQLTRDFTIDPASIIRTSVKTVVECILFARNIDVYEVRPELSESQRNFRKSLRRSFRQSRKERNSADLIKMDDKKDKRKAGISKTMAVAAVLEAKAIQARIAAKEKGGQSLDDILNDEDEDAPTISDNDAKPPIGMIRKRAHWGGSVMVEYSFDEGDRLTRDQVFPQIFDAVNTNFAQPCSSQVEKRGEYVVCKYRDFDYTKEDAKDAIDEMPYYVVVVERQKHAQWEEDEIFLTR